MWDATRSICISYNGEIYNFRELREECLRRGAQLRGTSDTEVIVALYGLEGERAFERLDGMFAFCLVDAKTGCTFLVRDPMGVKPLFYFDRGDGLCFASELPALLASGVVPFEIDRQALLAYLQLDYVPAPLCLVKGVKKLGPGECLRVDARGERQLRRFTRWDDDTELGIAEPEALARFDVLIRQSVERQLVSDVPIGVFLSGGIDSSIIASVASKVIDRPLHTFSIGFEDETFDESPFFDEVADAIGSVHHRRIVNAKDALAIVPQLPIITGEPLADGSIFPTFLLSRFARESVTVALSGDGADELFGGYPTYGMARTADVLSRLPAGARQLAVGVAEILPEGEGNLTFGFKARKFLSGLHRDPVERHFRWMGTFHGKSLSELVADHDVVEDGYLGALLRGPAAEADTRGRLECLLRTDQRFYLQDQVLVKADRASMANSLEVRPPFLSEPVVRFARALPARHKVRGRSSKHLLREWLARDFPPRISRRPKKGFGAPLARWFREELRDLVGDLLSETVVVRHGLVRFPQVDRLVREHWSGARDRRKEIFNLVSLALWIEEMSKSSGRRPAGNG
jgi:asparagine synthase (glutamine-hydrolysing)